MASEPTLPNKTAEFFYKLSKMIFYCGMPNFWIEGLHISKKLIKAYRLFNRTMNFFVYGFLIFELGAFFTKQDLNEKQEADLLIFGISHPMLWCYTLILSNQTSKIQEILTHMLELKRVYNNLEVEEQMLKKSKYYTATFSFTCLLSMFMYTFDAVMQVVKKGTTFTTVITAWPDINNHSIFANLARIVWNISWWVLMVRVMGVYAFVFSLTTSLSHQFINIQKYFYSLDDIFDMKQFEQRDFETKYEEAFKIGIELFTNTMHAVNRSKAICGSVFSGQIVFNIILLVIFMSQLLNPDRTLMSTGAIALSASGVLFGTGLFMCNAGDVTVEASHLSTAMYSSGWYNCRGRSSIIVRKMVVLSMMVAQEPVVIKGLWIMDLSYQSYVSIVKSSYSVFSLLY